MKSQRRLQLPKDYRRYLCALITLISLSFGFLFPNSLPRIGEAFQNLGTSAYFYASKIFEFNKIVRPTVIDMPSWEFAPSSWERLTLFPMTWGEFKVKWSLFWQVMFTKENFVEYTYSIQDFLVGLSKLLLVLLPLIILLVLFIRRYLKKQNNDYNKDSKPLKAWKQFKIKCINPVKRWFGSFRDFIQENEKYKMGWLCIWLLHFNAFALIIDFISYFLYFAVSFDFLSLYGQLLKLQVDLAPVVRFIPGWMWAIIGVVVLNVICINMGYSTLEHRENCNRGFLNERGVVNVISGPPGTGKTTLLTDLELTADAKLRDMAFEVLLESDLMFPDFPWCNLRELMKYKIARHEVVDIPSVKKWLAYLRENYEYCRENPLWYSRQLRRGRKFSGCEFDYDIMNFPLTYNDNLKIHHLYDVISNYAQAYFIYTIQTSYIINNYSVRTDTICNDIGNFPLYNNDFFRRDPRLMGAYSRHCHIVDFDMVRLGTLMLERNPNRNALGFGVYGFAEIDKERKNALELQELKIKDTVCNQRNDLFNATLKMSRHAALIANRVFIIFIFDLQRPEDWGAAGREVGEVIFIEDKGEISPVLPFFSPYWICEGIFSWIKRKWDKFYTEYIYNRSDNTLFVQAIKNLISKIDNHYRKVKNRFGSHVLKLEVESGRLNGDVKKRKYYISSIKAYSDRFSSDCHSAIFEGDEPNTVSIDDLREYSGIMATSEELRAQHSFFQEDIAKTRKKDTLDIAPDSSSERKYDELSTKIDCSLVSIYSLLFLSSTSSKNSSSDDN